MSETLKMIPSFKPISKTKSNFNNTNTILLFSNKLSHYNIKSSHYVSIRINNSHVKALKSINKEVDSLPLSIELDPISNESQFDKIINHAHKNGEFILLLWMASWCRKCIYLKPKLEKLATEYYQRVRFYSVDVNAVSHKFVVRAEVTKMPTIQLWKDSKKQAEVVGGHKAHLVVNEVRDMIEDEFAM